MKKIFTLAIVLLCASLSYAQYGILVNGKTYFAAEYKGKDGMTGQYDEYLAHVSVKSGDFCQLYDVEYDSRWAVDLDTYSVAGFKRDGNKYIVSVTGCYDFYMRSSMARICSDICC